MSPPGRPEGESPSAPREGSPPNLPGSSDGESASPPREDPPTSTPAAQAGAATLTDGQRRAWHLARAAWVALLALCFAWELWLAPVRPGGSWLVLKAVPLLLPLAGLWRGDVKTFQWALLLVLAYLMEGAVRAFEPPPYGTLAWIELGLVGIVFAAGITYLRPFKRAAKARTAVRA